MGYDFRKKVEKILKIIPPFRPDMEGGMISEQQSWIAFIPLPKARFLIASLGSVIKCSKFAVQSSDRRPKYFNKLIIENM